ncbi:MAG TPA: hypothetical protein VJN92_15645 [Candidatus Acidoferrum sp.]|nr:hypothetical protein [Candidatus Acidoferrum sp.]
MDKASTWRSKSYFRAVEGSDGTPWIICEPQGPKIPALSDGFIGFDLTQGTSLKEAEALADMLRRMVTDVSVTTFEPAATATFRS